MLLLEKRCSSSWGGGGGGVGVSVPSAWLSSFSQVRDLLLTCLQQFLRQAAPAAEVCHSVLPDLCIDVWSFDVALADLFISQLGRPCGLLPEAS